MTELRDYQLEAVESINAAPERKVLFVLPTGGGKTQVATSIMEQYARGYKSSLFVVHRREIVNQTCAKLRGLGVAHGVIMAGVRPRPLERAQVAAIQTLYARAISTNRMEMPEADLVFIDEAHRACAMTYRKVIEAYPNARIIGLTATPCRGDGRGLGGVFEAMIEGPQVPDLIERGHLVRTRVYAPVDGQPNLKGVGTKLGDYKVNQLADRMNTDKLVGNILVHWLKYSERRKTVIFAVDVAHSLHIRDEFVKAGLRAEHIDGSTPKDERNETLARLGRGDIDIVVNCMVLTEGWDMPDVGCCVLARPTRQLGLYRQMIGRVLRPAPGKRDAIVLDHSGAYQRHGFAEDRVEWTLDPDKGAKNRTHAKREQEASAGDRYVDCAECGALREGGKPCFHCGFMPSRRASGFGVREGELGLVDRNRVAQKPTYDADARRQWHAMLIYIARERGYSPGWPRPNYFKKFGEWPSRFNPPEPIEPTQEVRSWVRAQMIAYAKSKAGKPQVATL
jgi:superfamily II DNA or RNA helicase